MDRYELAQMMTPKKEKGALRASFGTLSKLYTDGTAEVLLDGSSTPQRLPNWSDGREGSRCMVAQKGTDWLILSASGGGSTIELADCIVETSENRDPNAGWVWEKWASGKAECWKKLTYSTTVATAWGNGFLDTTGVSPTERTFGAFPFAFVETPEVLVGLNGTQAASVIIMEVTATNGGVSRIFRSATLTTANQFEVSCEYIGRWSANSEELSSSISYRPTYELTAVPVPVGGIYETLDARNPADIWPGTAWEALGAGRQTIGAGTGYVAGSTGGSNVLTVEQMPAHNHPLSFWVFNGAGNSGIHYGIGYANATGSLEITNSAALTGEVRWGINDKGGSQPHTHPYIVVYRWKRLANVGIVEELNLQEITQKLKAFESLMTAYKPFTYTTEKQDTGRTTDDGHIIWGQKFTGAITAAANTDALVTLVEGTNLYCLAATGWWDWAGNYASSIGATIASGQTFSGVRIGPSRTKIDLFTRSNGARASNAYEACLDWTDGTLREDYPL